MADAEHLKLDDGTVIDIADAVARQKVGSAELQTTAKDCSGAINELKQSLDDRGTWVQLLDTDSAFSTTAKSFNLNDDFTKYKSLIIHYCQYQNVLDCKIVSSSYFNTTSSGTRPIFADWNSNHGVSVYKNTTTSVYVTAKSSLDGQYKVRIYGIK